MTQKQTPPKAPKNRKLNPRKLVSTVIYALIIVILLGASVILFASGAQNNPYPFGDLFGGKAMIWIMTDSMEPTIAAKSYILIERVDPADIQVGDVITFYSDDPKLKGSLNTHRVIEILGEGASLEFRTQGDNKQICPTPDTETAKAAKVAGRYIRNIPVLTAFKRFFVTPVGLVTVLLIVLALTMAVCLPDIIKYFKEKSAESAAATEAARKAEEERLIAEEVERLKRQDKQAPSDE